MVIAAESFVTLIRHGSRTVARFEAIRRSPSGDAVLSVPCVSLFPPGSDAPVGVSLAPCPFSSNMGAPISGCSPKAPGAHPCGHQLNRRSPVGT